jgi:hypothetical protein
VRKFILLLLTLAATLLGSSKKYAISIETKGHPLKRPAMFDESKIVKPGTVILRITLNENGEAKSVEVVSGDTELRPAVLSSARTWSFVKSASLPSVLPVWVYIVEEGGKPESQRLPLAPPPPYGAVLGSIEFAGVAEVEKISLLKKIVVRPGERLTEEAWVQARSVARSASPPLEFQVKIDSTGLPYIRIWR